MVCVQHTIVFVAVTDASLPLATAALYAKWFINGDKNDDRGAQGSLLVKNKTKIECITKGKPIEMIEVRKMNGTRTYTHITQ